MSAGLEVRKWVYAFSEGDGGDKQLLGGKGANLCEMTQIGLNVPPGFVITTEACREFQHTGKLPPDLGDELAGGVAWLQSMTGRYFGGPAPAEESGAAPKVAESPLLLSIRSGAPVSMPGMMDTILNLGIFRTIRFAASYARARAFPIAASPSTPRSTTRWPTA